MSANSVNSIVVLGKNNHDAIGIEATKNGIPVTINGGPDQDSVTIGSRSRNLNNIQADITVFENDGGPTTRTTLNFEDQNNTAARTFSIFGQSVTFSGSTAKVKYSGYADPGQNVDRLVLRGGSGGNTFNVGNSHDKETRTQIFTGASSDVVNVTSVSTKGVTIDGVAGVDQVTVGASFNLGLRDILGSVFVSNSNGYTDLILDDSGDTSASGNIRLRNNNVSGMGPVPIQFDPRGIQSLTVLASNDSGRDGNTIRVLDTPQNRAGNLAVNLKTGRSKDTVRVNATSSWLFIDGQNGLDNVYVGAGRMVNIRGAVSVSNPLSFTTLFLDNAVDTVPQYASITNSSFGVGSATINFVEGNLQSLRYFGGTGGSFWVFDTPQNSRGTATTELYLGAGVDDVNVLQTSGALTINGGGGLDTVNIGADGRVDQIAGAIDISNPPIGGRTTVNIDGSNEIIGHFVILDSGSLRGLGPAEIRFVERDLAALTVSAGPYFNTFKVINTPQNGLGNLSVTLNTGLGADTVRVHGISSSSGIHGQNGFDIVNVGLEGNMQGITSTLAITNVSSRSRINLDNSADTLPRSVTMDAVDVFGGLGSVTGLAPGQILYKQADLRSLNVWGGSGFDIFTVANTATNGVDPVTTIHAGQGGDALQVLGTTGRLVIDPQGNDNVVAIGGPVGTTGGTLDRIRGDIVLQGSAELTGNVVDIRDAASTGQYVYWMDSQRIYRTILGAGSATGSVYLNSFPLNGLTLAGAGNGNGFQIDGTPIHGSSQLTEPIRVLTGNGNDHVAIFGGSHPINIELRSGVYQTVRFGDAAHSLDAILGDVHVTGGGFIDTFISDEASTTAHRMAFENDPNGQFVGRYIEDANRQFQTLNRFYLGYYQSGRVVFNAGAAESDKYNVINIDGVLPNTEIVVNGGPSYDVFIVGVLGDTSRLQGPITINSPDADSDFAYFFDYASPVSRTYSLKTNPLDASGFLVEVTDLPAISFNGLLQLICSAPQVGNNTFNIQSSPATSLIMVVGDGADVTLGSSAPALGGNMSGLVGSFQFQGHHADDTVSLTLDDSGNNTTARNVTIEPYLGAYGLISGMGFNALAFADSSNFTIDIRGVPWMTHSS